jgi:formate hydrogenlyase subunit 3/multisubunit Na+/H+ antiporter MnhD subunit
MHKFIAILRLVGLLAFLAFIVSLFIVENGYTFNYLQRNLIQISFASFVILALFQAYNFYNYYIKSYFNKDDKS